MYKYRNDFHNTEAKSKYSIYDFDDNITRGGDIIDDKIEQARRRLYKKLCGMKDCFCHRSVMI